MKLIKQYWGFIKPFDIIIVALLVLLSFVPHAVFAYQESRQAQDAVIEAVITIDGVEVQRVVLSEETPHQEWTFHPHDGQYNIVEVDGTQIRNKEDNSPDQVAVKTGWISKRGQTAICLPHGFMIEIVSSQPATSDDDLIIPL